MTSNYGKVYIASMNMRGKWAPLPEGSKRINVTSSQSKKSKYRLEFSPMTPIEGRYKDYYCFENYWQSGKRFEGIDDIDKQLKWWKKQEKGKRRYPPGKNKKVKYAIFPGHENPLFYIESRKLVYVPEYYNLISHSRLLRSLKQDIKNGISYTIYDFDGPRKEDGSPTINEMSLEFIKEKINDTRYPFGHGYIIAATLMDIEIEDYI